MFNQIGLIKLKSMWILNKMMIGCQKASYLTSKGEEGTLSAGETLQLKVHLMACKMCKHFKDQSQFLGDNLKDVMTDEKHNCSNKPMSTDKKEALREMLKG